MLKKVHLLNRYKFYFKNPLTWLVVVARLFSSFYLFIDPFWGMLLYFVFDSFDTLVLEDWVGMTYREYGFFDKNLDWITYIPMLFVSAKFGLLWIFVFLFIIRSIGHLLYNRTFNEKYLLYFPNLLEASFFFLISLPSKEIILTKTINIWVLLILIVVVQMAREIILHVIYPRFLKQGILRTWLAWFGYNYKRKS